ncbi:MAG: hypothetical protein IT548_01585 [Alphaproteobacteria bacterium]|nr:hypothetical protein [Alphaproteobacteria bacterium]
MSERLAEAVAAELAAPVAAPVAAFAAELAAERDAVAVLFYGSVLRTGDLSGLLDFYVLTAAPHRRALRGWVERLLWPEIGFREGPQGDDVLRAKVATMPMAVFADAAAGKRRDTTIWTRFAQPAALAWCRDEAARSAVVAAVGDAVATAARFAVLHGPAQGTAAAFWRALFAETYRTEFRIERRGREGQILAQGEERYARLLPLAWAAAGIGFTRRGEELTPQIGAEERARLAAAWRRARRWGRPLNVARLAKASLVTEGAGRYAAWKLTRHSAVTLTPWQARHPVLAAPAILWRVWRSRG